MDFNKMKKLILLDLYRYNVRKIIQIVEYRGLF